MKKKLLISTLVVILILSMAMAMMVGCKKTPNFGEQNLVGAEKPTNVETVAEVSSGMSAYEMLQAGIANYFNAEVAVSAYNGNVATKVAGITINQLVESTKIRIGKGDATGNNANGAKYFADNKSYSIAANLYEKMVITPDEIKYKNAKKGKTGHKGSVWGDGWSVSEWNTVEYFDQVSELANDKNNDPTVLWMYDLQKDFVLEKGTTTPELKDGVWSFTLNFDPIKSTANYIETMRAQLEVNAGMGVENLTFEQLEIKVEMWDNGMIKRIFITESYHMKMVNVPVIKSLNSSITLNSDTQYAYAETENFKYDDFVADFSK